jgi:uncharacterized protein YggT (Ycf19 family)
MWLIDFILNLTALILWLNWRARHFPPLVRTGPTTLVGTLKRTETTRLGGWQLVVGLVALLAGRALFYWFIGAPVDWTPKLDLGLISLAFRSDSLRLDLLYSTMSFVRLLIVFYFWLLVLAAVNRGVIEPDPLQKLVRQHLSRAAYWPWPVQLVLPLILVSLLWLVVSPFLAQLGLVNSAHSLARLCYQGLLVGLGLVLTLKYLLPVFLLLHVVTSYVFLGNSPVWEFISGTARNLLKPLQGLPLRFARLDLAPIVGMLLILFALQWLPNFIVGKMLQMRISLWPQ